MKELTRQLILGWFYLVSGVALTIFAHDLIDRAEDILGYICLFVGFMGILVGVGDLLDRQNKKSNKHYKD